MDDPEELARIRRLQQDIDAGVLELLNILAILKGEVDLAVHRARVSLEKFYRDHPAFRPGEPD
jgi:hypothetical protein